MGKRNKIIKVGLTLSLFSILFLGVLSVTTLQTKEKNDAEELSAKVAMADEDISKVAPVEAQKTKEVAVIQNLVEEEDAVVISNTEKTIKIDTEKLNVRNTPSANSNDNIIGSLKNGDVVHIIGQSDNGWYQIEHEDEPEAYICIDFTTYAE